MEKVSDIQDYVDDAFRVWPELDCGINGLFGYVKEYNECFLGKDDNPDRAAHVILFTVKALKEGHGISGEIRKECMQEMEYLKRNYPDLLKKEMEYLNQRL